LSAVLPPEEIEVIDEERIVERGTAEITWFARLNDGWVHVSAWPGATSERLSAGPGTVWQSKTTLPMPRGSRLMRVESRPGDYARESPLKHLTRGATGAKRRIFRSYFVVGRSGTLISVKA
jgi:hypothetical protein